MAELIGDSPAKQGEEQVTGGDVNTQPKDTNMTVEDESNSGLSDGEHDGNASHGADGESSLPNAQCKESDGHGITADDSPVPEVEDASKAADTADVDATTDLLEGLQLDRDPEKKKRKNKKKSKKAGAAKRKNVTGFEEFYADVPMTPAEAAQEKNEIYSPDRSFPERIEECIQRFRAGRRLDSERTSLFNKYLFMGGVDSSQRQFTGISKHRRDLEGADANDIRKMTAIDSVGGAGVRFYDPSRSDDWEVDFTGIVKGFLSRTILEIYMYDEEAIRKAADLVKNFLNYVMRHDVCPEYIDDLMMAKSICEIAPVEMRSMHELLKELPGTFNTACRSLFCDGLVNDLEKAENLSTFFTFRLTVVLWANANQNTKEQILQIKEPEDIHVIETKEEVYEVVDVTRPRRQDIKMVEEQLEVVGKGNKVQPAGILMLKPSIIESGYDNAPRLDETDLSGAKTEKYVLEAHTIRKIEKGMKFKLVVCELNIGIRFIKEIVDARVSFDTFLPQSLMENWKEPVENERPPPSVYKPDVEHNALDAEEAGDD
ncbi:hypothetical protein F5B20DRAFT_534533 [Whalleya microplaca]|nr:hypothetical protein F5B20DRAFT_534533 [Whalleya microplaca]